MTLTGDRIAALLFLAFSIAYGVAGTRIDDFGGGEAEVFTARTFPMALAWVGGAVSLLMLATPGAPNPMLSPPAMRRYDWGRFALLCAAMVAYGLAVQRAGFLLSSTLFLIAGFRVLGERNWRVLLAASVPVVLFFLVLLGALGIRLEDPVLSVLGLGR